MNLCQREGLDLLYFYAQTTTQVSDPQFNLQTLESQNSRSINIKESDYQPCLKKNLDLFGD